MPSRALAWLRLVRVGTLFSPAADVVAGLCIAGLPWSGAAGRAMLASVAVYAAGMILNDFADRAEDRVRRPERPIPRGQVRPAAALVAGIAALAFAIAISPMAIYHAGLGGLVLVYDFASKRVAPLGALTMGALRGLNLASGAIVLTGAAPPRGVMVAALAYAAYIVAVTLLGILEDHPKVAARAVISVQLVPPLCAFLALLGMAEPWPAAAIAGVLVAGFVLRVRRVTTWDVAAIRGSMTWLLLGTLLYTGLLCLASGRDNEALAVIAAAYPARWISRRIALT